MDNIIIIAAILIIVGLAAAYIIKAKKKGQRCIGCPSQKDGCCSCNCNCNKIQ